MNVLTEMIQYVKTKINYIFKSPIQCKIESLNVKITDNNFYEKVEDIFSSCETQSELRFACSMLMDQTKELSSSISYTDIKTLYERRLADMQCPEQTRLLSSQLRDQYYMPLVEQQIEHLRTENNLLKEEGTVESMIKYNENMHKINALKASSWHHVTYRFDEKTGEDVYTAHTTKSDLNGYGTGELNSNISLRGRYEREYWSPIELRCPSSSSKVNRFDMYHMYKEDRGELSSEFKRKSLNTELQYVYNKNINKEQCLNKEYDNCHEEI